MSKTDSELMVEFQKTGNEEAFEEIVRRHRQPLLNFFFRLTWDRQLAEDCCQEVFCRLYKYRKSYVPSAKLSTFLYRIGKNLWIDRYRSHKNEPDKLSLDATVGESERSFGKFIEAPAQDPSRRPEIHDEFEQVMEALDSLAPALRETLILVKYQGMKYAEAAEVLDVPIGTVRSRIHAAIEQLRSRLNVEEEKTVTSPRQNDE